MRYSVDGWVKKLLFHAYAPLGWARAPNHVSLDLTRRCNLRCRMCFYYGGEAGDAHGLDELSSLEIISRVVNRLEGADYDLTGGEPLRFLKLQFTADKNPAALPLREEIG